MSGNGLRDTERFEQVMEALRGEGLDAVVCAAPLYILMLTGYAPVVGVSLAVACRDGAVTLLIPEDERELAQRGWAESIETFQPGSLEHVQTVAEAGRESVMRLFSRLGLKQARIGVAQSELTQPAQYAAMHRFEGALSTLLQQAAPQATFQEAGPMLERLASVKTSQEIAKIRRAAQIAGTAFAQGAAQLQPGLKETEAAARFQTPLSVEGVGWEGVARADGFAFCMSGPNAAEAYAAYQRSRDRKLQPGDLALVHVNSHADGYWTDITRTYYLGAMTERQSRLYETLFAARAAALAAIRPGVPARDVDAAARVVLEERGLSREFRHPTGHGIGFHAIAHNALPRLHPASPDKLETGMTFNVEPGLYFAGECGLRHCDMVAVTASGFEVLTPFASDLDNLCIGS